MLRVPRRHLAGAALLVPARGGHRDRSSPWEPAARVGGDAIRQNGCRHRLGKASGHRHRASVFEGMKRCSHYSGHDPAPDLPPDLPETNEVARDIDDLASFADMATKRHKQLGKARRYDRGVEAVLL